MKTTDKKQIFELMTFPLTQLLRKTRILSIFFLLFFFQLNLIGQVDDRALQHQMEQMQELLQEQLNSFDFSEYGLKFDTLFFKDLQLPKGLDDDQFIMPDDIDVEEMRKMMKLQLSQLELEKMFKMLEENLGEMDFSEMEQFFAPFQDGSGIIIPIPEEEGKKKTNPSKKRKVYKM